MATDRFISTPCNPRSYHNENVRFHSRCSVFSTYYRRIRQINKRPKNLPRYSIRRFSFLPLQLWTEMCRIPSRYATYILRSLLRKSRRENDGFSEYLRFYLWYCVFIYAARIFFGNLLATSIFICRLLIEICINLFFFRVYVTCSNNSWKCPGRSLYLLLFCRYEPIRG